MDIIEELIKKANKELQKIKIQTLGIQASMTSRGQRMTVQEESEKEVKDSQNSLSKNSSELNQQLKGNLAKN
ncbi:MAG: hypothetical protein LBS33_00895 [Streptococcaceae bacterium]|jgi:hypothetical protein|nr:hypothetical protein [Streptococcaceae bacterium]